MSHKDAPPITLEQQIFEKWWIERKGAGYVGFGRGKDGNYLAEFARDAFAAWKAALEIGKVARADKPDWKNAPKWAKYLAMDKSGSWWWYEYEPAQYDEAWLSTKGGATIAAHGPRDYWFETLEKRND